MYIRGHIDFTEIAKQVKEDIEMIAFKTKKEPAESYINGVGFCNEEIKYKTNVGFCLSQPYKKDRPEEEKKKAINIGYGLSKDAEEELKQSEENARRKLNNIAPVASKSQRFKSMIYFDLNITKLKEVYMRFPQLFWRKKNGNSCTNVIFIISNDIDSYGNDISIKLVPPDTITLPNEYKDIWLGNGQTELARKQLFERLAARKEREAQPGFIPPQREDYTPFDETTAPIQIDDMPF